SSVLIFLNRCVNLSRIFAKEFEIAQGPFLWRVYRQPMALALLNITYLWTIRKFLVPVRTWPELIAVGVAHGVMYCGVGFWLVVKPEHRALVLEKVQERIGFGYGPGRMKVARGVQEADGTTKQ